MGKNFGFDIRGDIKVFDFGLTKALSPSLRDKQSKMYNLTPITGSFPYSKSIKTTQASNRLPHSILLTTTAPNDPTVAPEVALKKPYDERCDCFSLSFLLFEMMALKDTPFHRYDPKEYLDRVLKGGERPTIGRTWPKLIKEVIKSSWDVDPQKRPPMKNIARMVRADMTEISNDTTIIDRTRHMANRSTRSVDFSNRSTRSIDFSTRVDDDNTAAVRKRQ